MSHRRLFRPWSTSSFPIAWTAGICMTLLADFGKSAVHDDCHELVLSRKEELELGEVPACETSSASLLQVRFRPLSRTAVERPAPALGTSPFDIPPSFDSPPAPGVTQVAVGLPDGPPLGTPSLLGSHAQLLPPRMAQAEALARAQAMLTDLNASVVARGIEHMPDQLQLEGDSGDEMQLLQGHQVQLPQGDKVQLLESDEMRLLQETVRLRHERDRLEQEADQHDQRHRADASRLQDARDELARLRRGVHEKRKQRNAHLARASLMESGVRANKSMPLKSVPIAGLAVLSVVVVLGFTFAAGHLALKEGSKPLGEQEPTPIDERIDEEPEEPFYNAEGMPMDSDALRRRYERRLQEIRDNPTRNCASFCLWYCSRTSFVLFLLFVFVATFGGGWAMWHAGLLTTDVITELGLHAWILVIVVALAALAIAEIGRLVTPMFVGFLVEARKVELQSLRYGYHPVDDSLRSPDDGLSSAKGHFISRAFGNNSYRRGTAYKWFMCGADSKNKSAASQPELPTR